MKFSKTKFCLIESKQQQQRAEDLISNFSQTLPLSQRNGCLEKIDSEYRQKNSIIFKRIDTFKYFWKVRKAIQAPL